MKLNPILTVDAYKISHPAQFSPDTQYIYSNVTQRTSRLPHINQVVVFGIQYWLQKYLVEEFNSGFFNRNKEAVLRELRDFFIEYFGSDLEETIDKFGQLHDLGYLPLRIKALPEGTLCPISVPFMTLVNTDPNFYWLTNFVETLCQNTIWNPITAATIARSFRQLFDKFAQETSDSKDFVKFQGHNFSMRGLSSLESSLTTDAGHLLSFVGSDTMAGNLFVKHYYGADPTIEMISCSVPATEHAVMCSGGQDNEYDTIKRLITEIYPNGIVSIVSDTWDLWKVITEILPSMKMEIMSRDGKTVIRPDSGNPIKILCGYFVKKINLTKDILLEHTSSDSWMIKNTNDNYDCWLTSDGYYITYQCKEISYFESLGVVELLWNEFGGHVNSKGFKELDSHIGVIYGDAITYERASKILEQLRSKGFASTNVVFGIGSFVYQYNTRDTFGIACKATWKMSNNRPFALSKDPVTDHGSKKSASGLLKVVRNGNGQLLLEQNVTPTEENKGELHLVFENGKIIEIQNFHDIRKQLLQEN